MFLRNLVVRTLGIVACSALLAGCEHKAAYTLVHERHAVTTRAVTDEPTLEVVTPAGRRVLGLNQLRALRTVEYRIPHPHLKRTMTFRGVLLSDLATELGLKDRDLRFEAIDDYGATILAEDYQAFPVLLAYEADGRLLTIKDKGPLTVVFPIHAHERRFPSVKYGSQWVWYVSRIEPR